MLFFWTFYSSKNSGKNALWFPQKQCRTTVFDKNNNITLIVRNVSWQKNVSGYICNHGSPSGERDTASPHALIWAGQAPVCALGPTPFAPIFGFKKKGVKLPKDLLRQFPQQAHAEQAVAPGDRPGPSCYH